MGYKNFQVTKELHLPIGDDDQEITLEQYKEKYGIDLSKYLSIESNYIIFNTPFLEKLYLILMPRSQAYIGSYGKVMTNLELIQIDEYEAGTKDAVSILGIYSHDESGYFGIKFSLNKDDELDIKNIKVTSQLV